MIQYTHHFLLLVFLPDVVAASFPDRPRRGAGASTSLAVARVDFRLFLRIPSASEASSLSPVSSISFLFFDFPFFLVASLAAFAVSVMWPLEM